MNILVLGASGMAGHLIALYMKEQGFNVEGFARRDLPFIHTIVGDAFDFEQLRKLILNNNYDIVINCIGILNKDAECYKANAVYLNSYLPHALADMTREFKTRVFQISTDCVFSGLTGPYDESSFRDGVSFYDRSKALGEIEDDKNLTIRCSIVGPDINLSGIGLFNWFMKQQGPVLGYKGALWTGITTLQLARIMESAASQQVSGLYNMVPDHSISKYDLLKLFNHYCRNDRVDIQAYDEFIADKTLLRTRFGLKADIPDYGVMVSDMTAWIKEHAYLYPQYAYGTGD